MNNKDYMARRFKIMEDSLKNEADDYVQNLERQFEIAIKEIDTDMRAWYQRFADNNSISLDEARRMLSSKELDEFKWDVWEYIKRGRENDLDGGWMKELENASARVHVSRLDRIKLNLRQLAEELGAKTVKAVEDVSKLLYTESYFHTAFEIQRGFGVGYTMQGVSDGLLDKLLLRPWTADGRTFRARLWTDKAKLIETVNRELFQMAARGTSPDKAIAVIAKQFETSKKNAGRVVMTESSFFASSAQRDCFKELGVEMYRVVGALDGYTCEICGDMDGRTFKMSDYAVGATAPPFHPWCRCCTAPYFADMEGIGERYARDVKTGEAYTVPRDMAYSEWKKLQDRAHGEGFVDKTRKTEYNKSADKKQYEKYKRIFGLKNIGGSFDAFRNIKYFNTEKWEMLKNEKQNVINSLNDKEIVRLNHMLGNKEVRLWYKSRDDQIPNMIDTTLPLREQAKMAHSLRNKYRTQARDLMADQDARVVLDQRHPNITFDQLLEHKKLKYGLSGDDAYRDIIRSSSTTNKKYDRKAGLQT